MVVRVSVGYDRNRIADGEIIIEILTILEPTCVSNYITEILLLDNDIDPHAGSRWRFYGLTITDLAEEFHFYFDRSGSGLATGVVEQELIIRRGGEVVARIRNRDHSQLIVHTQNNRRAGHQGGASSLVLVGDTGRGSDSYRMSAGVEARSNRIDQHRRPSDLAEHQSALGLREAAREPGLDQVLVLVEVDVEVVEHRHLPTLVGTHRVVGQVDIDAYQIGDGREELNRDDILHPESALQVLDGIVDPATHAILDQQPIFYQHFYL